MHCLNAAHWRSPWCTHAVVTPVFRLCVDAFLVFAHVYASALMAFVFVTPSAGCIRCAPPAVGFVLVMCLQCIGLLSRCDGLMPLLVCGCFVALTVGSVLLLQLCAGCPRHAGLKPLCVCVCFVSEVGRREVRRHFKRFFLRGVILIVSVEERHCTCVGVGVAGVGDEGGSIVLVDHGLARKSRSLRCLLACCWSARYQL